MPGRLARRCCLWPNRSGPSAFHPRNFGVASRFLKHQDDSPGTVVQATRQIFAAEPETKIVILTMHGEDKLVCEAIEAGAVAVKLEARDRTQAVLSGVRLGIVSLH